MVKWISLSMNGRLSFVVFLLRKNQEFFTVYTEPVLTICGIVLNQTFIGTIFGYMLYMLMAMRTTNYFFTNGPSSP